MKLPNGTNGANANPVPAAPINLRKSLRDNPPDFFVPSSDIQAELLAKLVINLVQFLVMFLSNDEYENNSDRNSNDYSKNNSKTKR